MFAPDQVGRVICFFFQAEDGIRDVAVTGVQTCALPISLKGTPAWPESALGRIARSFCPSRAQKTESPPGTKGKDAGHTDRETAWCSKPEEKDVLGISRLARCQELAGRTADDAVLTLKIL